MLKLRTKTEFSVPAERGVKQAIVRMIIDKLEMDTNNIFVRGYYYYYDENNSVVQLSQIAKPLTWSSIAQIEEYMSQPLVSTVFVLENIKQRLLELTFMQLEIENGENYNTVVTDWEEDLPIIENI